MVSDTFENWIWVSSAILYTWLSQGKWLWTSIDLEVGLHKSQTKCILS